MMLGRAGTNYCASSTSHRIFLFIPVYFLKLRLQEGFAGGEPVRFGLRGLMPNAAFALVPAGDDDGQAVFSA